MTALGVSNQLDEIFCNGGALVPRQLLQQCNGNGYGTATAATAGRLQ